ncbi:MAG: hypothetical protein ACK48P_07035 [Holosporales bacterium]|jgi:hypothetical protein
MNKGDTSGGSSEEFFPISAIKKLAVEDPNIAWVLEETEEEIQGAEKKAKEMKWCPEAADNTNYPGLWDKFINRYR